MGHAVGKDIYRKLGKKIDGLAIRSPWNDAFYRVLKALYSAEEADLMVRMPHTLSTFAQIQRTAGYPPARIQRLLEGLCSKGLVADFWVEGRYWYMPSPLVVGIFEMTMMRTGPQADSGTWAGLMHEYMGKDDTFLAANFGDGQQVSFMRTLVHEEALEAEFVEVLSYESALAIVEQADKFAIGLCSCRHEKSHLGGVCATPLDTCSSFGMVAEYLIRRQLAKEVSRTQMLENVARSKELRLVLTADNIKDNPTFICHCCKCCCGVLQGVTRHGYANSIVTASFISGIDAAECSGCGLCVKTCPVDAISLVPADEEGRAGCAQVDPERCIGCGVCGLTCRRQAVHMQKREKRVIHPATSFERVILQSLERGTLQNQLFDDPARLSHKALRGLLGGFFKLPPVKRALMSDTLRSTFLSSMKAGARVQGRDILTRM